MKFLDLRPFIKVALSSRTTGKLISLDVGKRYVGLAFCDESKQFVNPADTLLRVPAASLASANGYIQVYKRKERMCDSAVESLSKNLQAAIDKENACGVIVGIPLKDGKKTAFCTEIVDLMLRLKCTLPNQNLSMPAVNETLSEDATVIDSETDNAMPFTLWDEQYSTMEARRLAAQKSNKRSVFVKNKDSLAAAVIMKKFLSFAEAEESK
jgi:RNase H-fold protein (predicted Holliday junction resolvase)